MQCLDAIADPRDVWCGVAGEDGIKAGGRPLRHHGVGHGTDEAGWLSQRHGMTGLRLTLHTCTQSITVSVSYSGTDVPSGVSQSLKRYGSVTRVRDLREGWFSCSLLPSQNVVPRCLGNPSGIFPQSFQHFQLIPCIVE